MIIERVEFWIGLLVPIVINGVILKIYDATKITKMKKIAEFQSDSVVALVKQAIYISVKIECEINSYRKEFKDSLENNGLEEDGATIVKHYLSVYKEIKDYIYQFIAHAESIYYIFSEKQQTQLCGYVSSIKENNEMIYKILDEFEDFSTSDDDDEDPIVNLTDENFCSVCNCYIDIADKLHKIRTMLVTDWPNKH